MNAHFYTIAVLTAKEGRLSDLKATLETLAQETRKEPGALEYFLGLSRNCRISVFMQKSLLLVENVMVIPSKQFLPGHYLSDS